MSFPILQRSSPNQGRRPIGGAVDAIVLHADGSPRLSSSLNWIMQSASKVSYHYLVGRAGHVYECVAPTRRAWHAGVSEFGGVKDCNNFSVGVCLSNDQKAEPFADAQLEAGARVCAMLMHRFPGITLERITSHAVVALPPGRKVDPGPRFPLTVFLDRVRHYYQESEGPCAA